MLHFFQRVNGPSAIFGNMHDRTRSLFWHLGSYNCLLLLLLLPPTTICNSTLIGLIRNLVKITLSLSKIIWSESQENNWTIRLQTLQMGKWNNELPPLSYVNNNQRQNGLAGFYLRTKSGHPLSAIYMSTFLSIAPKAKTYELAKVVKSVVWITNQCS